eukprot:TRINITY_DN1431_c0_g3_i1.p1 TRINITY_DN1431_c0_g3~~TRINITY_DN1431_c0_g3_i1.p1  ORF type:complete len:1442 (-),score=454.68 TRINITY_DN1431_c0_g3_i1:144-4469(-)
MAVLKVQIEPGIPKLLVKINPAEAEALAAKNLGEVMLRKSAGQRGHVAVLHMSYSVQPGELRMSVKLAEILDVEEDGSVEISVTGAAPQPANNNGVANGSKAPDPFAKRRSAPPEADAIPPASAGLSAEERYGAGFARRHTEQERPAARKPFGGYPWEDERGSSKTATEAGGGRDDGERWRIPAAAAGQERDARGPKIPAWAQSPASMPGASATGGAPAPSTAAGAPPSSAADWLRSLRALAEKEAKEQAGGAVPSARSAAGYPATATAADAAFGQTLRASRTEQWHSPPEDTTGGRPAATRSPFGSADTQDRDVHLGRRWRAGSQPDDDAGFADGQSSASRASASAASRPREPGARDSANTGNVGDRLSAAKELLEQLKRGSSGGTARATEAGKSRLNGADVLGEAPTPARGGAGGVASALAESLEPSPVQSPRRSEDDAPTPSSSSSAPGLAQRKRSVTFDEANVGAGAQARGADRDADERAAGASSRGEPWESPPSAAADDAFGGSRNGEPSARERARATRAAMRRREAARANTWPENLPLALLPNGGGATPSSSSTRRSGTSSFSRRKSACLGALQPALPQVEQAPQRRGIPEDWRPPSGVSAFGGGVSASLEKSELGNEVVAEIHRWLVGQTSGSQCSQVVLDRALTVLSNLKLASGCQLEVLGGPLGAIVGGYNEADWLFEEVFQKSPEDALREAFELLGFRGREDGDWSNVASEEVSLTYRRMCLRGHPSRGGSSRQYLKLQVAMELVRAFSGEAGPITPMPSVASSTPVSRRKSLTPVAPASGFVLDDVVLVRELSLTAAQAEEEAQKLTQEKLEEMNRSLDEYILRQMCFKSEIVDEIARLHEGSAYAILGVTPEATDAEIKRAFKIIAMQCHPDKGGDKEDFQELSNAYERIMEQRKGGSKDNFDEDEDEDAEEELQRKKEEKERKAREAAEAKVAKDKEDREDEEKGDEEEAEEAEGEDEGEEGSNAALVEKAAKAAEEASRYAKTAAEFSHQAAEAAETARRGREQGSRDTLTKSIAHSAIVLTLTVVKAVRVVGYATLDVAAQCRIASKRNPEATGCSEKAVSAMSLGLDALNSALACAEVTETTAAELQAPGTAAGATAAGVSAEDDGDADPGSTAAAERFVGAAVRASLAAASASNAAMAAAIAAVEGSRECAKALEQNGAHEEGEEKRKKSKEGEGDEEDGEEEEEEEEEKPPEKPPPTPEEAAAAAMKRLVSQRNNNHKVLQRLNAEILVHQRNVKHFLQSNRQLIPDVSGDAKSRVFSLLRDYAIEARAELGLDDSDAEDSDEDAATAGERLLKAAAELQLFVPFLYPTNLAIPVSVKARVMKMAALYDLPLTMDVLQEEVFDTLSSTLPENLRVMQEQPEAEPANSKEARKKAAKEKLKPPSNLESFITKIKEELASNVAEEVAAKQGVSVDGAATPTSAAA